MTDDLLSSDDVRQLARSVLTRHATSARVRALFDDPDRLDSTLWEQMVELGWTGMEIPQEHGGLGAGFGRLVVLLEEMGRCTTGGPFLATTALGAGAVLLAGTERQRSVVLPRIANGEWFATVAVGDVDGRPAGRVRLSGDGASMQLAGVAGFVLDPSLADVIVTAARDDDNHDVLVLIPADREGLVVERVPVLDQTRSLGRVRFDQCEISEDDVMCHGERASTALAALLARAGVAVAADSVGNAREVLHRTADYARQRVQFGLPIGSFQGVKHQCANMFVGTETASTLVEAAADALTAGATGDAADSTATLASMAKFYACRNAADVAGRGIQLHGGIGYTWEHDMHIFLKRAKLNEALFGDGRSHLRRVADVVCTRDTDTWAGSTIASR